MDDMVMTLAVAKWLTSVPESIISYFEADSYTSAIRNAFLLVVMLTRWRVLLEMDDFTIVGCMNRKNMENETIKERFLGTIFGQAVGDALGLSTEFMSKQEVDRFYPNGIEDYSQIVQDDHRRRWQRGDWTDDTDMMLCILDSFVACQKVDILDIARRFKEWMMNGGMGIGRHTYNVMALGDYTSNPQKAAEIIWKMGKKKAAANGAVMRTSVVGLLKENVTSNAENICKLTHYDPRCVGSCVIVSSIIHALVFEDRILDYENVIGIAKQYDERIIPFIDLAYLEGLDSLCLDDEKSMGYTLRTLGAALWAYWHATSYKGGGYLEYCFIRRRCGYKCSCSWCYSGC